MAFWDGPRPSPNQSANEAKRTVEKYLTDHEYNNDQLTTVVKTAMDKALKEFSLIVGVSITKIITEASAGGGEGEGGALPPVTGGGGGEASTVEAEEASVITTVGDIVQKASDISFSSLSDIVLTTSISRSHKAKQHSESEKVKNQK